MKTTRTDDSTQRRKGKLRDTLIEFSPSQSRDCRIQNKCSKLKSKANGTIRIIPKLTVSSFLGVFRGQKIGDIPIFK